MNRGLSIALVSWLAIITPVSLHGAQADAQPTGTSASGASGCGDMLTVTYAAGTLNLGFMLSTATPGTWSTSIALQNVLYNLWSIPIPAVTPPVSFNVPIPGLPPVGPVLVQTTLSRPGGVTCVDWEVVDTAPGNTTLSFDGAGADSTPFTSYTDAGFTVAAVSGAWAVRTTYGHPAPYIGFTAPPGTAIGGEVRISAAGLPFSFSSVDLYSSTVSMPYVVTGLKNGATVFTVADVLPNPMGAFVTVPNPHATDVIDTLLISVTSPAAPCCPNPVGIDNIKVTD
jgi:hypothetical protein